MGNRNRDKQSRFGPPNNYGSSNPIPLMSLKTGRARSYEEDAFKTPEQLAFDNEFAKWHQSFEDWKSAYANHPDRSAYREYERKFLEVRDKLLLKRRQIYGDERGGGMGMGGGMGGKNYGNSYGSPFDNQLCAADAMANSILSKFDNSRDFRDDDRYIGGYSRDGRSGYSSSRDRMGGRDRDRMGGRDMDRRGGYDRGGRDRMGGRDGGRMGGNDRGGRGGNNRADRPMPKPSKEQLNKELSRRDVYPNSKWYLCSTEERPPLVGKRGKKKNTKIQNVIERKRKIAAGEIPLEELPFSERIDKMFEIARNSELPKLLPGSGQRRLKNLRKKNESEWTCDERKFVAYCDYVSVKRGQYFEEKKKREAEEAQLAGESKPDEEKQDGENDQKEKTEEQMEVEASQN